MKYLPEILHSLENGKPGDMLLAFITQSGRQVIKTEISGIKRSAVRYPGTGTIVETIVHKMK